jgi:hypothetical protein
MNAHWRIQVLNLHLNSFLQQQQNHIFDGGMTFMKKEQSLIQMASRRMVGLTLSE